MRKREKLRRLDLGSWTLDIVQDILPDLTNLRVLAVHIGHLSQEVIKSLVESIPRQMVAIRVFSDVPDKPLVHILPNPCLNQLICLLGPICSLFHSLQYTLLLAY